LVGHRGLGRSLPAVVQTPPPASILDDDKQEFGAVCIGMASLVCGSQTRGRRTGRSSPPRSLKKERMHREEPSHKVKHGENYRRK
jgi:hypothetical protein